MVAKVSEDAVCSRCHNRPPKTGESYCVVCEEKLGYERRVGDRDYEVGVGGMLIPKRFTRNCLRCSVAFEASGRFQRFCTGCSAHNSKASVNAGVGIG